MKAAPASDENRMKFVLASRLGNGLASFDFGQDLEVELPCEATSLECHDAPPLRP